MDHWCQNEMEYSWCSYVYTSQKGQLTSLTGQQICILFVLVDTRDACPY